MPAATPRTSRASSKPPPSAGVKKLTAKKSSRNLRVASVDDIPDLPSGTQKPRNLTFGVEIEGVLAFHETLLRQAIDKYFGGVPVIRKDLPEQSRYYLNLGRPTTTATQQSFDHVQWALQYPNSSALMPIKGAMSTLDPSAQFNTRKYYAEPLVIAKELLAKQKLDVDVVALTRHKCKAIPLGKTEPARSVQLLAPAVDYTRWTLSYDDTLFGLTGTQLYDLVGDSIAGDARKKGVKASTLPKDRVWDSAGFELISPILDYSKKDEAYRSIADYLAALRKGHEHRAVPTVWGALQVHVGFSDDNSQPVVPEDIWRHLGYILINHEDLISRLHPRRRCGLPLKQTTSDRSRPPMVNRGCQPDDTQQHDAEESYTSCWQLNSHKRWLLHKTDQEGPGLENKINHRMLDFFFRDPRSDAFISFMQKPKDEAESSTLAGTGFFRGYRYNFDNLRAMNGGSTWKTPKPTVEFRQHASTLCPKEIGKWVDFCCALVRFAERMADTTIRWRQDPKLSKTFPRGWGSTTGAFDPRDIQALLQAYPSIDDKKWPCECINRFLGPEMLDLDDEGRTYWRARYDKYKDEYPRPDEIVETSASHFREFGHRSN